MSGIVQYVVVRGDLARTMGWPLGAVIAQACHACTAVIHLCYNDAHTQAYLADLDNMHKVVLEVSIDFREGSLRAVNPRAFNHGTFVPRCICGGRIITLTHYRSVLCG